MLIFEDGAMALKFEYNNIYNMIITITIIIINLSFYKYKLINYYTDYDVHQYNLIMK